MQPPIYRHACIGGLHRHACVHRQRSTRTSHARLTPDKVLSHPWIAGGKASDKAIGGDHIDRLKLMQARRVLKRGVRTIIAVNRFKRQLNSF